MDLDHYVTVGVRCDAKDCTTEVVGPPLSSGNPTYLRRAVAEGWTLWRSRGRRAYCRVHKPRPGHRMQEITHYYNQPEGQG